MSIAANDLRNPLSSINLAVDMIESDEQPDRNTILEYTELIKVSSNRMIALINDVLKIHTIDAYENKDSASIVEVNPLVEESLQHFFEPARSKNIRIRPVLNRTIDPLSGNSDYILRILDNLMSNAIKYSPKNSDVIISTKQTNGNIQISVRDQGPGITPAEQKNLFKKFSKLSNKPTGNESSTGLGLYIVKKSVHDWAEPSVVNRAGIVDLHLLLNCLPAAKSHAPDGTRPASKKTYAVGNRITILGHSHFMVG